MSAQPPYDSRDPAPIGSIPDAVYAYVADEKAKGVDLATIRRDLAGAGYTPKQVEEIIDSETEPETGVMVGDGVEKPIGSIPDTVYTYALEELLKGVSVAKLRSDLGGAGYTPGQVKQIISVARSFQNEQNIRGGPVDGSGNTGQTNMLIGGAVCLIGLVVTVGSMMASSGGGTVVVAWGAIVFGAIQFMRGASQSR